MVDRKAADATEAGKSPDRRILASFQQASPAASTPKGPAMACVNRERKFYPEADVSFWLLSSAFAVFQLINELIPLFSHWFIHSFNKYLLNCTPGTVPSAGHRVANKAKTLPSRSFSCVWGVGDTCKQSFSIFHLAYRSNLLTTLGSSFSSIQSILHTAARRNLKRR